MEQPPVQLKVVMAGSTQVGKTALINQLCRKTAEGDLTVGVDSSSSWQCQVDSSLGDRRMVQMNFWDVAGRDDFRAMVGHSYRGATVAFLVFDLCDKTSFRQMPSWFQEVSSGSGNPGLVKVLVGNKVDLAANDSITAVHTREVDSVEARALADAHGAMYVETSAVDGTRVEPTFREIAARVIADVEMGRLCYGDTTGIRPMRHLARGRSLVARGPQPLPMCSWLENCLCPDTSLVRT